MAPYSDNAQSPLSNTAETVKRGIRSPFTPKIIAAVILIVLALLIAYPLIKQKIAHEKKVSAENACFSQIADRWNQLDPEITHNVTATPEWVKEQFKKMTTEGTASEVFLNDYFKEKIKEVC
ncbi:MAG: hypothetical protein E7423_08360 [Ruminococcaceae bacterium]|nr:hypothetical protein [Oscillospiraceae bacterium]